jgi:hypothetical protein
MFTPLFDLVFRRTRSVYHNASGTHNNIYVVAAKQDSHVIVL